MRDHLLGCQAFMPPEPDPEDRTVNLRRRFPLGMPVRAERELDAAWEKALNSKQEVTAFEEFDHTPPEMQDAFPREYDLTTMLNEAAARMNFAAFERAMAGYNAEMQRLCGYVDLGPSQVKVSADAISVMNLTEENEEFQFPLSYFANKPRR